MPIRFPFSRFPYPYYMYQPRYRTPYIRSNNIKDNIREKKNNNSENCDKKEETNETRNNTSKSSISNLLSFIPTSIGPLNFHPEALSNNELPLFEMFGICLFLDDIIIICILIFLYQEQVADQMLYISLLLLLFA